jgi:hypothetical protein
MSDIRSRALARGAAGLLGGAKLYVDDVFSTYLYTGNGSTQTINNGIDLAGKGGLVWIKDRVAASSQRFYDTARGANNALFSNLTNAQLAVTDNLNSFGSSGFEVGALNSATGSTYASWTFRKAPKFFDVVTFTAGGSNIINHSLGSVPGCVIIKSIDIADTWWVVHRGANGYSRLNSTAANSDTGTPGIATSRSLCNCTSTTFDASNFVSSGNQFVAYLFAHDAGGFGLTGTDNVISCGSFTTDGSGNATVNLGYEPQWALIKPSNSTGDWVVIDNMRSWTVAGNADALLYANSSAAEVTGNNFGNPTATGFVAGGLTFSNTTYIYIAIRRPHKPPTSGTEVFSASQWTSGLGWSTGFPVDANINTAREFGDLRRIACRLAGNVQMFANLTNSEAAQIYNWDNSTGLARNVGFGTFGWNFRRAPGFFDVVCYAGTGINRVVTHNLSASPELIIVKSRDDAQDWSVYSSFSGADKCQFLNKIGGAFVDNTYWNNTNPSPSVFSVGSHPRTNGSGLTYVAYLFASLPGVSKVGSYTGNGSSQTINCAFTTGARFALVKRTDAAGDWYVWDSARGIVAANDPRLSLNTAETEVSTDDSIDPDATGFIVNQNAATNINVAGGSYIFLAIA